jgi:hypothetical protein
VPLTLVIFFVAAAAALAPHALVGAGGTAATTTVGSFLERLSLEQYAEAFAELGVDTVDDFQHLESEDLDEIQMKRIHRRKLVRKLEEIAQARSLQAQNPEDCADEEAVDVALEACRKAREGYAWTCDYYPKLVPKCAEGHVFTENGCIPTCDIPEPGPPTGCSDALANGISQLVNFAGQAGSGTQGGTPFELTPNIVQMLLNGCTQAYKCSDLTYTTCMKSLKEIFMRQMRGRRMLMSVTSGLMTRYFGRFAEEDFVEGPVVPIDDDEANPVEVAVGEVVYMEGTAHFSMDGVRYQLQSTYDDDGNTIAVAISSVNSEGETSACTLDAINQTCTLGMHDFDLAFFGSVGVATSGNPRGELELYLLPADEAKCNDGTPAGFYYSLNPESTTWTIYMEGGGTCQTEEKCLERQRKSPDLTGSGPWGATKTGAKTYSRKCSSNPDFCDANFVYIRYCSSDSHRGQRTTSEWDSQFWFTGHTNFKAIASKLVRGIAGSSIADAEHVLLNGCSSGGTGVWTNVDTLAAMVPNAVVKGAPGASIFFSGYTSDQPAENWWVMPVKYANFTNGETMDPDELDASLARSVARIDQYQQPGCVAANPGATQRCYLGNVFARHVTTPILLSINMFEEKHMTDMWPAATDGPDELAYQAYFANSMRETMNQWLANSAGSDNGLFMPACHDHCTGVGVGGTVHIQGHLYEELLGDWYWGRNAIPHVLVDDCGDAPCNPDCDRAADHVDLSSSSGGRSREGN